MSKDDIQNVIIEAGDRLYTSKNSPMQRLISDFTAEIINNFENLLLEVLYDIEEIKKAEEQPHKED